MQTTGCKHQHHFQSTPNAETSERFNRNLMLIQPSAGYKNKRCFLHRSFGNKKVRNNKYRLDSTNRKVKCCSFQIQLDANGGNERDILALNYLAWTYISVKHFSSTTTEKIISKTECFCFKNNIEKQVSYKIVEIPML